MKLTETEWQLMNALWKKYPSTARELTEMLPQDVNWAYTTIKTMLSRLLAKGAVSERKRANTSVYTPLISQQKARRSAIGSLLNQAFDGAMEPMLHFLVKDRKLSTKEKKALIEILRQEDKNEEKTND